MSDGQKRSGSREESQSKGPSSSSGCQSVNPTPSSLLLTVENVKKLQEEYPSAKSALARQSVETYIKQNNLFLNESEGHSDEIEEQNLSAGKRSTETFVPHGDDDTNEDDYTEESEKHSSEGFQPRSMESSVPQASKKCEFADLETQTEWSYSDATVVSARQKLSPKYMDIAVESKEIVIRLIEKDQDSWGMDDDLQREDYERRKRTGAIGDLLWSEESFSPAEMSSDMMLKQLEIEEDHSITDLCRLGNCEFCSRALKPFPTVEELDGKPEVVEEFLCCRTYKDVFQCVVQELIQSHSPESEIDIAPHHHLPPTVMESHTKRVLMEEIKERGFEKYRAVLEQYMKYRPTTKVAYKLSDHPPKPKPAPPKKRRPPPKELLKIDKEFKAEQLKICQLFKPVRRYYADGKLFYLFFPDGTGQVYYPSGKTAVFITYENEVQFTYIILSDNTNPAIQAFFTNQGCATCYYPNGDIRLNLDLCSGSYFDLKGRLKKHWTWWDTSCHVHAPPFQSLGIQLNIYINVKIEAQDRIFLTFTKLHDCLQLNVGARLKLKDPKLLQFLKPSQSEEQIILLSKTRQIRRLFIKLRELMRKLRCTPADQIEDLPLLITDLSHWRGKMTIWSK